MLNARVLIVGSAVAAVLALTSSCAFSRGGGTDGGAGGASGGGSGGASGGGAGGGDGGGAGGGNYLTGDAGVAAYESACADYQNAQCEDSVSCGLFDSLAGCNAYFASALAGFYCSGNVTAGIHDGRESVDPAMLESCASAVSSNPACTSVKPPIPACGGYLVGNVPPGGQCFERTDCASGNFCDYASGCPGICTNSVPVGQPATSPYSCVVGSYIYQGYCTAFADAGASCAPFDGGAAYNRQFCALGSFCNPTNNICEPFRLAGEACPGYDSCWPGWQCRGTCKPYGGIGDTCGSFTATDGGVPDCKFDLHCDFTSSTVTGIGTCQPAGGADAGCLSDSDCAVDLFCNAPGGTVGHCQAKVGLNASCQANSWCQKDSYCAGATAPGGGTCAPSAGVGQPCDTVAGPLCKSGSICMNGACQWSQCLDPTP